jgi:hypothetical protein
MSFINCDNIKSSTKQEEGPIILSGYGNCLHCLGFQAVEANLERYGRRATVEAVAVAFEGSTLAEMRHLRCPPCLDGLESNPPS